LAGYRSPFREPRSWHDEGSMMCLGRERRDRPGRPLAVGGATRRQRRRRPNVKDAIGLQHVRERTRRRRRGDANTEQDINGGGRQWWRRANVMCAAVIDVGPRFQRPAAFRAWKKIL
jgi:hypothetical protein